MALLAMVPTGIGVGLTFPTVIAIGTSALPASAFATGSAVINMIRQAALAIGVAVFVALLGKPASLDAQIAAFHLAWWILAAVTLLAVIPATGLAAAAPSRK